ncbi:MAG: hypothetical protein AVO35_05525 [Candidatus Aegiribacteria sp. MLS_C]|nr:MAG: hypothetical protein AVO35_05525 [Candidatus Aegiribacteria sp. MLS_C]
MRTAALLLAITFPAASATLSEVEFIGFSHDGSLACFGQYWTEDGSGFPGAEMRIVSVAEDSTVRVFEAGWTEEDFYGGDDPYRAFEGTGNPAWDEVLAESGPFLDSVGISGAHRGFHCICHLPSDTGVDPWRASFATWIWSPLYIGPEYNLSLLLHPAEIENPPDWLSMFGEPVALELFIEDGDGRRVMHRADREGVPAPGYEYVLDYRIRDVYVFSDSMVAIVLSTSVPGFEGPDGMHRMVTGMLDSHPGPGY